MKIKIMYPNQMGKLEFTKEQLEELLKEAYDEGYRDGQRTVLYTTTTTDYWYKYPSVTCTADSALSGKGTNEIYGTVSSTVSDSGLASYCDDISTTAVSNVDKVNLHDIS